MLVHDRYTLRSYPFEVVLRGLLVWAGQRLDEDDILIGLRLLDVYPFPSERHFEMLLFEVVRQKPMRWD